MVDAGLGVSYGRCRSRVLAMVDADLGGLAMVDAGLG